MKQVNFKIITYVNDRLYQKATCIVKQELLHHKIDLYQKTTCITNQVNIKIITS